MGTSRTASTIQKLASEISYAVSGGKDPSLAQVRKIEAAVSEVIYRDLAAIPLSLLDFMKGGVTYALYINGKRRASRKGKK